MVVKEYGIDVQQGCSHIRSVNQCTHMGIEFCKSHSQVVCYTNKPGIIWVGETTRH